VTSPTNRKQASALTIATLARSLERRELTAEAVTEECLAAIAKQDGSINAFITVLADDARAQARQADAEIAGNRYRGGLHGIPVCVKDIIDMAGVATTAASRVRRGHVAEKDAASVARLRAAGAVIVGKTNLHEFALGTTNEDSAFGPVRHPLDSSRSYESRPRCADSWGSNRASARSPRTVSSRSARRSTTWDQSAAPARMFAFSMTCWRGPKAPGLRPPR
jgi:hypothetical protein